MSDRPPSDAGPPPYPPFGDGSGGSSNPYASPKPIAPEGYAPALPGGYYQAPPSRPAAASVFGVMNIVWGTLGLFTVLQKLALVVVAIIFTVLIGSGQAGDEFPVEDVWYPWAMAGLASAIIVSVAWFIADVVIEVLLFRSGSQLLKGRMAGRATALRYCVVSMISQVVPIGLALAAAIVALIIFTQRGEPEQVAEIVFQVVCQSFSYLSGLIYPVVQFFLLRQRSFVEALAAYEAAQDAQTRPY